MLGGKIVAGANFPSCLLGARTESLERGLGNSIGVDHYGIGGNDGAMLLVKSVSVMISMWI